MRDHKIGCWLLSCHWKCYRVKCTRTCRMNTEIHNIIRCQSLTWTLDNKPLQLNTFGVSWSRDKLARWCPVWNLKLSSVILWVENQNFRMSFSVSLKVFRCQIINLCVSEEAEGEMLDTAGRWSQMCDFAPPFSCSPSIHSCLSLYFCHRCRALHLSPVFSNFLFSSLVSFPCLRHRYTREFKFMLEST